MQFWRLTIELLFSDRKNANVKSIVLVQNVVGVWEPDKMFPCVPVFSVIELRISVICVYSMQS